MGITKLWNAIAALAGNIAKLADTIEAINDRLTLEALPVQTTTDDHPTVLISNAAGEPVNKRGRRG